LTGLVAGFRPGPVQPVKDGRVTVAAARAAVVGVPVVEVPGAEELDVVGAVVAVVVGSVPAGTTSSSVNGWKGVPGTSMHCTSHSSIPGSWSRGTVSCTLQLPSPSAATLKLDQSEV
jgi:hypothetical protein